MQYAHSIVLLLVGSLEQAKLEDVHVASGLTEEDRDCLLVQIIQ